VKSEPICGFGICFTSEEWVFVLMSVFGAVIFIVGLVAAGVWLHTLFTAGPASMLRQHRCRAMGCGQVATHEVRGVVRRKDQRLKVCREHIVWMVSGKEIRVRSLGRRQSPIRCDFCERNATGALVAQWTDRGLGISGGGPRRQESRFCETHKEAARDRLVSAAAQGGVDNPGLFGRVLLQR
jgi:hypothetical protein